MERQRQTCTTATHTVCSVTHRDTDTHTNILNGFQQSWHNRLPTATVRACLYAPVRMLVCRSIFISSLARTRIPSAVLFFCGGAQAPLFSSADKVNATCGCPCFCRPLVSCVVTVPLSVVYVCVSHARSPGGSLSMSCSEASGGLVCCWSSSCAARAALRREAMCMIAWTRRSRRSTMGIPARQDRDAKV